MSHEPQYLLKCYIARLLINDLLNNLLTLLHLLVFLLLHPAVVVALEVVCAEWERHHRDQVDGCQPDLGLGDLPNEDGDEVICWCR